MLIRRITRVLPLALVAAFAGGCTETGDLTGTVSYRGQPLKTGTIQVRGADGVVRSATINPDGTYTLPDVPAGSAAVGVACRDPREVEYTRALAAGGRAEAGGKALRPKGTPNFSLIPASYSDLDRSGLSTTVKSGSNRYDIELK